MTGDIRWPEAVAQLTEERSKAEICVASLNSSTSTLSGARPARPSRPTKPFLQSARPSAAAVARFFRHTPTDC
jgi:hypothetical protein